MASQMGAFVLSVCVFLVVAVNQGEGLRCWLCTSDAAPHCADPFNTTTRAPRYSLVDCDARSSAFNAPFLSNTKAVCRKTVRLVRNERIITRSCAWEDPNEAGENNCMREPTPSFVKIESCHSCDTDGCNAAPTMVSGHATLGAVVVSFALAKMLSK